MADESTFGGESAMGPGTFGSGLSSDMVGGGATAGPGPVASGADVPPDAAPSAPPAPGQSFGSSLRSILPGPHYNAPDPAMSALDQSADMLQQRIARANAVATNPLLQFFNPEGVQKARDFAPAAAEKLQQIRTQQAAIMAGKQQAATLGLAPGEVADEATQADRVAFAQNRALKGDLRAFKGLQAVDPKAAEAIQAQVYEVGAGHLTKAQYAFDSLSGMTNPGQYAAKVNELRKDGTLTDLEALGMKVPGSFDQFNASKGQEAQALREARIGMDGLRNTLEQRNTYQGLGNKESEPFEGRLKTTYGDNVSGKWGYNASTGTYGLIVNGAADPRNLGKSFTLASPEQRKALEEESDKIVPKEEREKYRSFNRTYQLATTDAKGNPMPADKINTNPNVQQGIAEGLASMLRGGSGGANIGLLKIETSKRGFIQGLIDKISTEKGAVINELKGKDVNPYLSTLTQAQIRDVMDTLKQYNDVSVGDRVKKVAERAGALGLDAAAIGYGDKETAGSINDAIERGKQAQIARMSPGHQAIGGGDGVFQLGAQAPGAGATGAPQGTSPTTQLPGAAPVATPVQQAAGAPPAAPAPPPPGVAPPGGGAPPAAINPAPTAGGGQPPGPAAPVQQTIAGQPVSVALPPGASPNYLKATQRIESGNEKDPWKAGAKGTSASGAFQFTNATWAANKPAGAPDRAGDATPAQQAEGFANVTRYNASKLTAAGLPVDDVNLYVTHNLGEAGGPRLLKANPDADARTVVGEVAAKNNPLFFRGRPTVAVALERYRTEMAKGGLAAPGGEEPAKPGLMARVSRLLSMNPDATAAAAGAATPEQGKILTEGATEHAPAIGSTLGAITGSAAGPAGAVVGGGVGGAAGQSFKDYMQGRPQNPTAIAKEGALGAVLGVASEARPFVAAGARVLGAGAAEGGAKAIEGGDAGDIADAALTGGAYGLGGEALGRFISAAGPVAHKVLTHYTPSAQAELSVQAGKLAEARQVLATEQPKLAGEGAGPNPKYEAAKKTEEEATQYIKDHNQKPDDMVYAYEQAKAGTSAGEALTLRKANSEKSEVSQGYDQLREDVRAAKPGEKNIKPNQAVPDGPLSTIRTPENPTGKVPEVFRADAEHAEMLVKAPAKNWGDKWQQLQDAGTELIKKRMDYLAAGEKTSAAAMNEIFQGVRNQQKAVATRLFGEKQGAEVIAHLENLDKRYAKVMNATAGMNYKKMGEIIKGGNTPERRELEANFKEFAKDDPSAIRAFNAMKAGASGRMGEEAKLMIPVIAGEFAANASGIPSVGLISAAIGGHRLVKLMGEYMNAKILGKPVTFKDFAVKAMKDYQHGGMNMAGSAAQRGAVQ